MDVGIRLNGSLLRVKISQCKSQMAAYMVNIADTSSYLVTSVQPPFQGTAGQQPQAEGYTGYNQNPPQPAVAPETYYQQGQYPAQNYPAQNYSNEQRTAQNYQGGGW